MHSKGNHKQNEKTTLRMGENICKTSEQQGITLQNKQTAQKKKNIYIYIYILKNKTKNPAQLKNRQRT